MIGEGARKEQGPLSTPRSCWVRRCGHRSSRGNHSDRTTQRSACSCNSLRDNGSGMETPLTPHRHSGELPPVLLCNYQHQIPWSGFASLCTESHIGRCLFPDLKTFLCSTDLNRTSDSDDKHHHHTHKSTEHSTEHLRFQLTDDFCMQTVQDNTRIKSLENKRETHVVSRLK